MKANGAPEKLYISYKGYGVFSEDGSTERTKTSQIEYIRTDVFIEKACAWIKESITNNPECNRILSKKGVITMGEIVKDFRKYMEEE